MKLIQVLERSVSEQAEMRSKSLQGSVDLVARPETQGALQALNRLRQAENLIPCLDSNQAQGLIETLMKQFIAARRKAYAIDFTLPEDLWENVTIKLPGNDECSLIECDKVSRLKDHPITRGDCKTLMLADLFKASDVLDFVILPFDVVNPALYVGEGEAVLTHIKDFERKLKAKHWKPYVLGPPALFQDAYYIKLLLSTLGSKGVRDWSECEHFLKTEGLWGGTDEGRDARALFQAGARVLGKDEVYPGHGCPYGYSKEWGGRKRETGQQIVNYSHNLNTVVARVVAAHQGGRKLERNGQAEELQFQISDFYTMMFCWHRGCPGKRITDKSCKRHLEEFRALLREIDMDLRREDKAALLQTLPKFSFATQQQDPILFAIPDYVESLDPIWLKKKGIDPTACKAVVGACWGPDLGKEMLALIAPFFMKGNSR